MLEAMKKRSAIRMKRGIRKKTEGRFSGVKLGVVTACVLLIAADLLYFGGAKIANLPFIAKDTGRHSPVALSVNNRIALAGMKDIGIDAVDRNSQILDQEPRITTGVWDEVQFIPKINVLESDKGVVHDTETTSSGASEFKEMSFGEMGPVPIMPSMLCLGLGMAALMAIRSRIIY